MLRDTLRVPFDLSEAESELVRGLNTEHMSFTFTLIFLSEYSVILMFRVLSGVLFFGGSTVVLVLVYLLIIQARATFVRVKPDWVMSLLWWKMLPCVLLVFMFT